IEMKIETEPRESHMENFLRCLRTRQTPVLDADTAYRAMVPIGMAVQSYCEGRVLYFDEGAERVGPTPPKAYKKAPGPRQAPRSTSMGGGRLLLLLRGGDGRRGTDG